MNRDQRIYRRSTLLQMKEGDPDWEETVDSLEVVGPIGDKDGRFQLLTDGLQLPACSFVSRSDNDAWFIDTGVDDDLGRIYIGEHDFTGMAGLAGFVSKAGVSRVYEENERLNRDLSIARNLITDLRAALASLVGAETVEGSSTPKTRQRTTTLESISLGDKADPSDLDLDAL